MTSTQALLSKYDHFIFDLDNTLYDERGYLYAAFSSIAQYLREHEALDADEVYLFLRDTFDKDERKNLFDKLCTYLSLNHEKHLPVFLDIQRTVVLQEKLPVLPLMEKLLKLVDNAGKAIYVVTNGTVEQQRNKVGQIQWPVKLDESKVYYANAYKPKPAPDTFFVLFKEHQVIQEKAVYIGDTETDKQAALSAGIDFVHIESLLV